jgi:hypothetical protein
MQSIPQFRMGVPQHYRSDGHYAFWLDASEKRLLTAVYALTCVDAMRRHRTSGRILVEIHDDHDPDEAWHWIYSELESAANFVELDEIWEEAIRWLL